MEKIFKNSEGKVIGSIKDSIFVKTVKKSKHFMRVLNSWGIDKAVLDSLQREGVKEIHIRDTEEKKLYKATVDRFLFSGETRDMKSWGVQVFLNVNFFDVEPIKSLAKPQVRVIENRRGLWLP